MSLIIVDIDHFKKINDTYEYNTGDLVILKIAKLLVEKLREIDIVCRWGGEEFVILLPAVNIDNALLVAEKLRSSIEELEIKNVSNITASFGVSCVREEDDVHTAVNRADIALYSAKAAGRNRVEKASPRATFEESFHK